MLAIKMSNLFAFVEYFPNDGLIDFMNEQFFERCEEGTDVF